MGIPVSYKILLKNFSVWKPQMAWPFCVLLAAGCVSHFRAKWPCEITVDIATEHSVHPLHAWHARRERSGRLLGGTHIVRGVYKLPEGGGAGCFDSFRLDF